MKPDGVGSRTSTVVDEQGDADQVGIKRGSDTPWTVTDRGVDSLAL